MQRWFDRSFDFTLPLEHYPILCTRLRGTPARLDELVSGADCRALTAKAPGKWSAQEHAGHLLDLEPLWLARVDDFRSGREALTPADLTNQKTNDANHAARDIREILAAFRTARSTLIDVLAVLPPEMYARALVHPRLGQPMRLLDHLQFVAEHDDHHLAIIAAAVA
jgi:uncharacterized damage-inducible protein DinB